MIRKCVLLTAVLAMLSGVAVGQYWNALDPDDPTDWNKDLNWRDPAFVPEAAYLETAAIDTANLPSPIISAYTNPFNVVVGWSTDLGTCQPKIIAGGELFLGNVGEPQNIYVGHDYLPGPAKGVLILDGGTISNILDLFLGTVANAEGTFIMNSGTYASVGVGAPRIGWGGKGTMTINGGTATTNYLQIGVLGGSNGTLNVNGGTLSITTNGLISGVAEANSVGTLNQTGGTITVTATVVDIASVAGSSATFNLSGGTFNYNGGARFAVGFSGNGTLNVSGTAEINVPNGVLRLAQLAGSTGVVNMTGGVMNLKQLNVGHNVANSSAKFNLHGGTVYCNAASNAFNLEIGKGTMDIRSGVLVVNGDRTSYIQTRIDGGHITGWNTRSTVSMDYNVTNAGKTTVWSVAPANLAVAWKPSPANSSSIPLQAVTLTWQPGEQTPPVTVVSHNIYFGTDKTVLEAIATGNTSHAYYLGNRTLGNESIAAPLLAGNTTYYWRVDEVNSNATITKGDTWQFSTLPYTVFDNFETYTDTAALQANWNASGTAAISLVTGGDRPVPLDTKFMAMTFGTTTAETTRTFASPVNLAAWNIQALYLAFHGTDTAAGLTGSLYIKLTDNSSNTATVTYSPTSDLFQYLWHPTWRTWKVKTSDFAGVDMSQLKSITLGVASASTAATVYFDNIRGYIPSCWRDKAPGDFRSSNCLGDMRDLETLSRDWGKAPAVVNASATEPTDYVVYYSFDAGTTVGGVTPAPNAAGSAYNLVYPGNSAYQAEFITTTDRGYQSFGAGGIGGTNCLILKNQANMGLGVQIPNVNWTPIAASQAFTIAVWANGDMQPAEDRLFRAWDDVTTTGTNIQIADIRVPGSVGDITFQVRDDVPAINYQASNPSEFAGQWNHYAFTYDKSSGVKRMYINGVLVAEGASTATLPAASNMDIAIGGRPSNNNASPYTRTNDSWAYSGKIDDFKIYSRALSQAEIVRLAKGAGGSVTQPPLGLNADANGDNTVNLADLTKLVEIWLTQTLWP